MKLRKHQHELNQAIDGIIGLAPKLTNINQIILAVVPGGGKGSVPVNAGKLIMAGLADAICCIVPRQSLQKQCEEVFMDPFFKKLFGVNLQVRASTNEMFPCRGMNGFVTTYQALGHDKNRYVLQAIKKRRYIVILDEFHHVEKDSPWHQAVEEILDAATFKIMMSGTLSRANGKEIACVKYRNGYVDLSGDKKTHVIRYTRSEAISEQAILPIDFHLHDGEFQWQEFDNNRVKSVSSFEEVKKEDRSSALFTALKTEFAEQLMDASLVHWLKYKKEKPAAKILFVCAGIDDARRCIAYLKSVGISALLATSHDETECQKNIDLFKRRMDVLVTIAIAYEGLDVPPISHVCILTRIRSVEWMTQCVGRATRVCKLSGPYHSQAAHIFAPKDQAFMEFVAAIEKEQSTRAKVPKQKEEQIDLFPVDMLDDAGSGSDPKGPCIPLKSQILELSRLVIGKAPDLPFEPIKQTPKERELSLRKKIDRHLKKYAYDQGYEYPQVMREARSISGGKPRNELTLEELEFLWTKIQQHYPVRWDGQFVPKSNCPPVFEPREAQGFNISGERFF